MSKLVVFLDMDGVMANFEGGLKEVIVDAPEMFEQGFFKTLAIMPGAKEGVDALLANPNLDLYIGSKCTTKNLFSATEKMEWIREHFPALLRRMVLTCDKGLLLGDYLIDDDHERWGHKFKGTFVHFDKHNPAQSWESVVELLTKASETV